MTPTDTSLPTKVILAQSTCLHVDLELQGSKGGRKIAKISCRPEKNRDFWSYTRFSKHVRRTNELWPMRTLLLVLLVSKHGFGFFISSFEASGKEAISAENFERKKFKTQES